MHPSVTSNNTYLTGRINRGSHHGRMEGGNLVFHLERTGRCEAQAHPVQTMTVKAELWWVRT